MTIEALFHEDPDNQLMLLFDMEPGPDTERLEYKIWLNVGDLSDSEMGFLELVSRIEYRMGRYVTLVGISSTFSPAEIMAKVYWTQKTADGELLPAIKSRSRRDAARAFERMTKVVFSYDPPYHPEAESLSESESTDST